MIPNRTFRLFISSTFSDFTAEREALQKCVFPELERFCAEKGARFQAVDLRWGITEEAQVEHDTMRICLEEVRHSQLLSPRPNFAVLLGDRYGWEPVPARIPLSHWDRIIAVATAKDANLIIAGYQGPDHNAVPPVYHLHNRKGTWDESASEENQLLAALRRTVDAAGFQGNDRLPYFASATHQEIALGALLTADAPNHVHVYVRRLEGLPKEESARHYIDWDAKNSSIVPGARDRLAELETELRTRLSNHVHELETKWDRHGKNSAIDQDYLDNFCKLFLLHQKNLIASELSAIDHLDEMNERIRAHLEFGASRSKVFAGRKELLTQVAEYTGNIEANLSTPPLVLIGFGGSGKSALLAKSARSDLERESNNAVIVQRYIGGVPGTESLMTLLLDLTNDISRLFGQPEPTVPENAKQLFEAFVKVLGYSSTDRPLHLYLDALDQLDSKDNAWTLEWLPIDLPVYSRIVVSLRASTNVEQSAKRRFTNWVEVPAMNAQDGRFMLDAWLADKQSAWFNAGIAPSVGRQLTLKQKDAVLNAFCENGSALWLKLAYEEASTWASWDEPGELPLTVDGLIKELIETRLLRRQNHPKVFTERALAYLTAGRSGLSEEELGRVLGTDEQVREEFQANEKAQVKWNSYKSLPPIIWSRLFFDLQPYLGLAEVDGAIVMRWFHREFTESLKERYLSNLEHKKDIHGALADMFKELDREIRPNETNDNALFKSTDAGGKQISVALRRVMEQPWQLSMASRYDDLRYLLTDFGFCMGKCAYNQIDDLLENYDIIKNNSESKSEAWLWMSFVFANAHILRRGVPHWPAHKILLQLSVEHADDSIITKAAQVWLSSSSCDWVWIRNRIRPRIVASNALLAVMEGHSESVYGTKLLPGGRVLSWGDCTLRLWDSENGAPLAVLEGHKRRVLGGQLLTTGEILSWSQDGMLNLWDAQGRTLLSKAEVGVFGITGAQVLLDGRALLWSHRQLSLWDGKSGLQLVNMLGHAKDVYGAKFLPGGQILSWTHHSLHLWSEQSGVAVAVMEGTPPSISNAQILSNGRIMSWGGTAIRLWDSESGAALAAMQGHTNFIWGVRELPNSRLVSWSSDNTLRLWNSDDGKQLAVLNGHKGRIWDVEVLPDGRLLSWSTDGTLRLWDAAKGDLLAVMQGHTASITGVKVLPSGRFISWAGGHASDDNSLRLWDGYSGASLAVMHGHLDQIEGVEVLSNNRLLSWSVNKVCIWDVASGLLLFEMHAGSIAGVKLLPNDRVLSWTGGHDSNEKCLHLWDCENGELLAVMQGHSSHPSDVLVISDSRVLTWAGDLVSNDHTLRLWDTLLGKPIAVMKGHTGLILDVIQLPTGRLLSWSSDGSLRLWDCQSGQSIAVLEGHLSGVSGVKVLADNRILSWSMDKTLRLWDAESGELIAVMKGHTSGVDKVQVLGNQRVLSWASGYGDNEKGFDKSARLWDISTGELISVMSGHTDSIKGVEVLADGRILTWAGNEGRQDKSLRLWDGESGASIAVMDESSWWTINGALILPEGQALTWGGKTLRLWDLKTTETLVVMQGHTDSVLGALQMKDGRLLSWSADNSLRIWDRVTGAPLLVLQANAGSVLGAKLLPDGRLLSWSVSGTLCIWDGESGALLTVLEGHIDKVLGAQVLSDGRLLSWSADSTLRLWDGQSGAPLALLEGHKSQVSGAQILPSGQILSWSSDKTLRLWNCVAGSLAAGEVGHSHRISFVEAVRGARLLSWAEDKTLRLWDVNSGLPIVEMKGHKRLIRGAKILHDGRVLSWSDDQTLRLWDPDSGTNTATLQGHTGSILDAQLLPDGRLVSWSDDGTILFWDGKSGESLFETVKIEKADGGYFLPDGRGLSWDVQNNLRFWDASTGATLKLIEEDSEYFPSGYYSRSDALEDGAIGYIVFAKALPNDMVLVAFSVGTLYLWDSNSGDLISVLEGHQGMVEDAEVIDSEGNLLSWAEEDATLRLWSPQSGSQISVCPAFWIDVIPYPSPWEELSVVAGAYRSGQWWSQGTSQAIKLVYRKSGLHVRWHGESLRLFGLIGTTAIVASGRKLLLLDIMNSEEGSHNH